MADEKPEQPGEVKKRKRGCLGWFLRISLVLVLLLIGLLVWFNGPGMRWLVPGLAKQFLEKDGITIDMRLGGTLLGGINVYDLDFQTGGQIKHLVVDRLKTDYRFRELIKGQVRGISGEGVHLDFRLIRKEEEEEKPPMDFEALGKTLNSMREKVVAVELDLKDVSVAVEKDDELFFSLDESALAHKRGEDLVKLNLGLVTDGRGQTLPRQNAEVIWDPGKLTINRLDLLPILGLRDVKVSLPEDGKIALEGDIRLSDAVMRLNVSESVEDVSLELVEGELNFGNLLGGFGLGLPIEGVLKSLSVEMRQVYPDWQTAVGTADIVIDGFAYDDWQVPELSLGLVLDDGKVSAAVDGKAYDSAFSIDGSGEFERAKILEEGFVLDGFDGNLRIENLDEVLGGLNTKMEWGIDLSNFPKSVIGGTWDLALGDEGFSGVGLDVVMEATEVEAAKLHLAARYEPGLVTVSTLESEGLQMSAKYHVEPKTYEGSFSMENFDTRVMGVWERGFGVELPGYGIFDMAWEGGGDLGEKTHNGSLKDLGGVWEWNPVEGEPQKPSITAGGSIEYDWPESAEVSGLKVSTQGQIMEMDARLANDQLELDKLSWTDGDTKLAEGSGTIPVPEDFAKFKEFIANDSRPLDFQIVTETLPLSKLEPWVGQVGQLDQSATGKVDLKLGGSLAAPEVDLNLQLRDVSVPAQPKVPKTDLTLKVEGRDGLAKISAEAVAPDYAPATLDAEMAFFPKKWADDPELLKSEKIQANLSLPRIDISRFQALVPNSKQLAGILTGGMTVTGTVGAPKVNGEVKLTGGRFSMEGNTVPPLEGINLQVDTDLNKVTLKGGVDNVAGGNLTLGGEVGLKNEGGEGLGELDFSVRARGLPLVRNEFLITRANIDLSLKGPITAARISGEVGILDSVFYKDMELIPIGKPFLEPSAAALPSVDTPKNPGSAVPAPFDQWTADVVIKTIDPILVRGNLGTGQVDVALRVEGKLGDPKPNGKVRLSQVEARLPFSTLRIDEGFVTFTPATGFDPILEIRGTSEPRPYRVQVYVYGRASDPQLVLTSEPPLPENEIMTLIATGTTTSGLEDSQAASSRAMQLLIEELRRGRFLFGKQLRPLLGLLDNVDFSLSETDPYDSDSYNSATLKLSDKWYISAGLGEEGEQRVLGIWRLRFR
ncbi:translocation/assembly module TamB domain-containing protein [Luteolibacter sp. AS25]|uniref:translocation/assembly module TamB domain-containing protein n=1 Tax=Luteolibacter sp. AS25 TaxID=3135776 RepID=UPI00398AF035